MKQEEIIAKRKEVEKQISVLRIELSRLDAEAQKLYPHKVGEIINVHIPEERKKDWLSEKEKVVPEKNYEAVLYEIRVLYFGDEIECFPKFKRIRKDGGLSQNDCSPARNFEWTGRYHKDYAYQEKK